MPNTIVGALYVQIQLVFTTLKSGGIIIVHVLKMRKARGHTALIREAGCISELF